MSEMFCFQCEQTAKGTGCASVGVCGKDARTANAQDELTCALIDLAAAAKGKSADKMADELMMQGLFITITNVNFDSENIGGFTKRVADKTAALGGTKTCRQEDLWAGDADTVSLRWTLLLGLRGMAAYAWHAHVLGKDDPARNGLIY